MVVEELGLDRCDDRGCQLHKDSPPVQRVFPAHDRGLPHKCLHPAMGSGHRDISGEAERADTDRPLLAGSHEQIEQHVPSGIGEECGANDLAAIGLKREESPCHRERQRPTFAGVGTMFCLDSKRAGLGHNSPAARKLTVPPRATTR